MTATTDLIVLLESLGQRDDGLGQVARGHARRLKRPFRRLRTREDHLHSLEGFSDLAEAMTLLERETARRLADLIIGAWQEAWRIDREGPAR